MYVVTKENDKTQYGIISYLADKESDVDNLPTTVSPGSTCIVIETSNVYILNTEKVWKLL